MRALFGILLLVFTAVAAGIAGFQAGVASNVAAAGGVVWLGGWFPGFGFLFFLLFIGFMFFAFAGRRGRGPWGMYPGRGPWGPPGEGDPRRQWIAEAHRRLHEEEAREASSPTAGGTPTSPGAPAG
jgi:hypothetical protein